MDPQLLVLIFVLAGIVLIFAELFLPSGGVIALMCACSFLAAGYFAYQAWYASQPYYFWTFVGFVVLLIPSVIVGGFHILANTSLGNRVITPAPTLEEVTPYQEEQARLAKMIGQRGHALGLMTPGGMVEVNGERLHASSNGLLIEAGATVEIVAVRGTRVVVREVKDDEPPVGDEELAEFDESTASGDDLVDPFSADEKSET